MLFVAAAAWRWSSPCVISMRVFAAWLLGLVATSFQRYSLQYHCVSSTTVQYSMLGLAYSEVLGCTMSFYGRIYRYWRSTGSTGSIIDTVRDDLSKRCKQSARVKGNAAFRNT